MLLAGGARAAPCGGQPEAPVDQEQRARVPLVDIAGAVPLTSVAAPEVPLDARTATHLAAAQKHFEARDYAPAAAELDAALDSAAAPTYELLYLLAQIKLALLRPGEARLAAEQALLYRPDAVDAHVLLARLHRRQERLAAAIAHLRSATLGAVHEPDSPRATLAWYELGDALAEAGHFLAAAEALERFDRLVFSERPEQRASEEIATVLKLQPYGAIERRLELLQRVGRETERVAAAMWAFDTRPNEPYLERLYVRALLDAGQADAAFVFCRDRLATAVDANSVGGPPQANRLTLAIDTARTVNRLDQWIEEVVQELAAGAAPDFARTLAARLAAAGDSGHAMPLWRALTAAHPDDADATWALASALKESGDLAAALGVLIDVVRRSADAADEVQRAADIPPQRLGAWMRSFAVADDFLRQVTAFTQRGDCDFATYTVLATTAAAAGQTELAERLFNSALEQRPGFPLAHLAWGRLCLGQYRWDEALEHATQALQAAAPLCAAHLLAAEAYAGLDDYERAEPAYRAALQSCPDDAAYALALARYLRRAGHLLAAQRYFQQAWSQDRSLAAAVEELADCYLDAGKIEIARECLQQAEASDVPDDVLRRIRTAIRFAAAPYQDAHLAELSRQFEQHPDDAVTGLKLAGGLFLRQRPDDALRVLENVQTSLPDDERVVHLRARLYLRQLDADKAIHLLAEAARRYPRRPGVLRLLATAYAADFRIDEARQTLRRLLDLDLTAEQELALREELLNLYVDFGEFDGALELVERWLADEPDEPVWPRAATRVLLEAGRGDEAVLFVAARLGPLTDRFDDLRRRRHEIEERLRRGAENAPSDATQRAELSAQLDELENNLEPLRSELFERRADFVQVCEAARTYAPAVEKLRGWLADEPPDPRLQEWLIEVLLAAKRGEEALTVVSTLLPKTPADVVKALIWRARGYALVQRGDEAIKDLSNLLSEGFIQENSAARDQVRQEILGLLIEQNDPERALEQCERWLAATPEGDEVTRFSVLGLKRYVLSTIGREAEALAVSEQFLEIQPYDPGLNNDVGYTWAERGEQVGRALQMIELAVAAEPLNAAFLDSLGWAHYQQGDFAGAQKYLSRAARLRKGQDATIYDHRGDAEYRLGDRHAAREQWQAAAELLSQRAAAALAPRAVQLLATVRAKLEALERSASPAVAPIADEREQERP
jgi:tetratricopeptide (TPR) repeat protein